MINKVAVVTGASKGIGKAIVQNLLQNGYKVYGISTSQPSFKEDSFVWIELDLAKHEKFSKIEDVITEKKIDILVNNAGVIFEMPALEPNWELFEKTFSINLKAPILLTKILKNKLSDGLIINISSVSDRLVGGDDGIYCASKAALNIYFDAIAYEEKDLKIISLLPSYVDTPLLRRLQEGNDFNWDMIIKPEQIAELVDGLINDQNNIESGTRIIIVSEALKEDFNEVEKLWGYNVDNKRLIRLKNI